jgi:hypothetical protein
LAAVERFSEYEQCLPRTCAEKSLYGRFCASGEALPSWVGKQQQENEQQPFHDGLRLVDCVAYSELV